MNWLLMLRLIFDRVKFINILTEVGQKQILNFQLLIMLSLTIWFETFLKLKPSNHRMQQ